MLTDKVVHKPVVSALIAAGACCLIFSYGCSREPSWKSLNDRIIKEQNISVLTRDDIPETGVVSNLVPGEVINKRDLPDVELAPGVTCKMYWGKGNLVNWMTMKPGAEIPREQLPGERLMVVWKGSVDQLINGQFVTMRQYDTVTTWTSTPHRDFVYLQKGAENAMKAGSEGAEVLEVYWPVRLDYVQKAGGKAPSTTTVVMYHVTPPYPPNQVLDFYDVQFTDLSQATANSRLISGIGFQCSFLSADPGRVSPFHAHPEEQLTIILRASVNETVMDKTVKMEEGDILYLPGGMVHRGQYEAKGCDMLDVFWPPRPDFIEKMNDRLSKYHALIPRDAKPVLVHDGAVNEPKLIFTEGPSWMNGELFFSNMWFAQGFTAGSPEQSNFIRMNKDGSFTIIISKMQTNGTMPLGNGNLAVCDMFGHRLLEVTRTGKIVRTLARDYNGVPIDGPNDLVIDAKGGIYITDPQVTPGLEKTQPVMAVYYRKPDGKLIRVIEAKKGEMPNGILLSPDGKTCYVNRIPTREFIAAYDVNEDGTLSNMRTFAKCLVTPQERDQEGVRADADGMTIDMYGNVYAACTMGLQIFSNTGEFIGMVNVPIRPVSCVFGGEDMQTIYITCPTRLYAVRTNVKGLEYPLK